VNTAVALANLTTLSRLLTVRGVVWWLLGGTCLGAIRDGCVMEHDPDTDLGIWPDSDLGDFRQALDAEGFTILRDESHKIVVARDGVTTDLFYHFFQGRTIRHRVQAYGRFYEFAYSRFALKPCDVLGFPAWVPDPVERYLTENYGDWSHPDPGWSCIRDSHALVPLSLENPYAH